MTGGRTVTSRSDRHLKGGNVRRYIVASKSASTATEARLARHGGFALKLGLAALGFLGFCAFMVGTTIDASAATCPPPTGYRSIGGTCYFTNGVLVDTQLFFTGNLQKNPKRFSADLTPGPNAIGMLFCGNNGGNQAKGQRVIPFTTPLSCDVSVQPSDVDSSQNGGTADHVLCNATLTQDQLDALDGNCTPGQFAIDFVPCSFDSLVKYKSLNKDGITFTVIEEALHRCTLPSCETLLWDNKAGTSQFRPYDCIGPISQ
jgi:hypothetical protein